jgi:hypothetical protein
MNCAEYDTSMSSLWTPGGEHEVPREPASSPDPTSGDEPIAAETGLTADMEDAIAAALPEGVRLDDLTPEQLAQAEEMVVEMAEARERLTSTPASTVVANHAMGLYELAALHLSQQTPNFSEATVAIDGLTAIVESLAGRLGDAEPTLREGLDQLRMVYVQLKNSGD